MKRSPAARFWFPGSGPLGRLVGKAATGRVNNTGFPREALCDAGEAMIEGFQSSAGGLGPIGGFLERFRRSGGVPASVGGEAASELEPLFLVLDSLEREIAELLAHAQASEVERVHEAEEQAQSILTAARERSESERDDAWKAGQRAVDAEVAAIIAQAHADAKRIRETGEERLPSLVSEVLARVLEVGS